MKSRMICLAIALACSLAQVKGQGRSSPPSPPAPPTNSQQQGSSAAPNEQAEGEQQHQLNRLSHELNLTEQQRTNMLAIFEQMRLDILKAYGEAKTNAQARLQTVLTPEQYQKLQLIWLRQEHRLRQGDDEENEPGRK